EQPLVYGVYLTVAILHILGGLSIDSCRFAILGIRAILSIAFAMCGASQNVDRIILDIPAQVSTVVDRLEVAPSIVGYVCC
ncbi:hypothetical protein K474DRAFT_1567580, partial [Panus rudis PR-1116 ss-1]